MAKYENEGYCPRNQIWHYQLENEVPSNWEHILEILGDRIEYMVYSEAGCSYYGWSYIVECLAISTLGEELAKELEKRIPMCRYPEEGKKILCTDLINPFKIPGLQYADRRGKRGFASNEAFIIQDDKFLVGITEENEAVHLYFFFYME